MPEPLRGVLQHFWQLLDSENVRLFVWPYYIALFSWGVYGSFFAVPNTVIEPVMGHAVYNMWVWLCIGGTAFVMIGMLLGPVCRWVAAPITEARAEYCGLWMQLGGHICMGFVLFAYEFSAIVGTPWGRGSFAIFAIAPYVLGCLFLAMQAARKMWKTLQLGKNLSGGVL